MAHYFSYLLGILGLVLLVIGYRKTNRNLLLAAALVLCFGAGFDDFSRGFMDGVNSTRPA